MTTTAHPFESVREQLTQILMVSSEATMYADVLDVLLDVFESQFGFFGYIDTAGDLVCPSMTRDIFPQCQVPDKDIVFERAVWGGLWGRVLTEQVSLVKNANHRVPEGHLPISRSFGTPILYRGDLIGQFHLANRDRDYDERDIELLEQIAAFIAPVLSARLRRGDELRARLRAEAQLRRANEELAQRVAELERMTAALIDREERMIELKAELATLRAAASGNPDE